jgi:hypothetical protein
MDSRDEAKLKEESRSKEELANAFPLALRQDALVVLSALSENRFSSRWRTFSLRFGDELLAVRHRIHYAPPILATLRFNRSQREILDCLFTRHHDGFVRQTHLARIIRSQNAWVPCFVVPLVGEYVVEILWLVHEKPELSSDVNLCGLSPFKSRISKLDRTACPQLLGLLLPLNQEARVSRLFNS